MQNKNHLQNILYGDALGDALGVPVEFESRDSLKQNPINTITGFGTHDVRGGVWSDDSSMTFCLAETIVEGFDLQILANKFIAWKNENYWTPLGEVFDIGISTSLAIGRLAEGIQPELADGFEETDNGNGSLMRILPLVLYLKDKPITERFQITKQVSSLTHGHIRSVIACFYYLEFARQIIKGKDKFEIYENLKVEVNDFLKIQQINPTEIGIYNRLLNGNIYELGEDEIKSSGYVVHTLEASIWCILTTDNYVDAVLKAVNLGEDTVTTGAVTGGLTSMLYGFETIPKFWITVLPKIVAINELIHQYQKEPMEIKGLISFKYIHTTVSETDEFSKKYPPVDYQTEATLYLPNEKGKNVLTFQLQYPKYPYDLKIVYDLEEDTAPKTHVGAICLSIFSIAFLSNNEAFFSGSFGNYNDSTDIIDNFKFSMYFKYESLKSVIMSSTTYADIVMCVPTEN